MTIIRSYDELPEPNKRQTLIVLKERDYKDFMMDYKKSQFLLDENICYLIEPSNDDIKKSPILKEMDNKNQLTSGMILVQDCDNTNMYLPYDEGIKKSITAKMNMFAHLCQLLGAKQIDFSITELQTTTSSGSLSAKAPVKTVDVDVSTKTAFANELERRYKQSMKFQGMAQPDLSSAEKLVTSYIFQGDVNIIGFYNQAKYLDNRMQEQKCQFTLAEKATKSLSVVANANFPLIEKKIIDAKLDMLKEATKTLQVEYTVVFP